MIILIIVMIPAWIVRIESTLDFIRGDGDIEGLTADDPAFQGYR